MNWFKRKIREWSGVDDVHERINRRIDRSSNLYTEDYKALAKRVSTLEEEVFDCSDDDKEFTDEG